MILTAAQKGKGRAQVTETTPKRPSKALVSRLSISSEPTSDSDANSSDSDSSTPHSSSSGSESDSEDEIALEHMKSLLEKARQIAREKKIAVVTLSEGEDKEEEVIHLEVEPEAPQLPSLDPGSLPPTYIVPGDSRKAGPSKIRDPEVELTEKMAATLSAPAAPVPPREPLTKKERKALKNKTAGPNWFDLPAPAEADLPRLHREVEALRLRNQLDPKRFYRKDEGEGKGIKGLPKHFAIGTIVATKSPFGGASGENLTRTSRKRTLVDELVDDAETKSYAKKKFKELQTVRGARGRGTLAKKMAVRKGKW